MQKLIVKYENENYLAYERDILPKHYIIINNGIERKILKNYCEIIEEFGNSKDIKQGNFLNEDIYSYENPSEIFIVEKGIKIPFYKSYYKKFPKYPFKNMEIGDSFLISEIYSRQLMSKFSSAARNWANKRNNGWEFTIHKVPEGIRIWRIK